MDTGAELTYEQVVIQIILNGGDARGSCLKAIGASRAGNDEEAHQLIEKAKTALNAAHQSQTNMIQAETRGEKTEMTLLMVHAQDHLMNAMTVKDLAVEMIEEIKLRRALEASIEGRNQ